ncbi:hypothetical protein SLS58_006403 [Diplodia intermedia]|uniref:Gfd2/YDR514C-like C-terminal domain-containing protein n=1 Tax=Diplodia intermedia TaxID=856260 RepID=A0ABR3TNH7_9PEZI
MAPNNTHPTNKPVMSWAQVASSSNTRRSPALPAQAARPAPAPAAPVVQLPPTTPQVVDALARATINAERVDEPPTEASVPSNTQEDHQGKPAIGENASEELTTAPQPDFGLMNDRERMVWALNNDALIVSIDVEEYMGKSPRAPERVRERKPATPTEIGISISDPLAIPTASRLDVVQRIMQSKARHVRVKELSHLTNPQKGHYDVCEKGCEDHFQFGQTEFTSTEAAKQILREMLMLPRDPLEPERGMRPVALLLHDARGDTKSLCKLDLDLSKPSWSHMFIVDTQLVADRHPNGERIGLKKLMARNNISSDHHHNSGNDALRTLVVGLIYGIPLAVAQSGMPSPSSDHDDDEPESLTEQQPQPTPMTPSEAVEDIRTRCKGVPQFSSARTKGDPLFCGRCHSKRHLRVDCNAKGIRCRRCGQTWHMTEVCIRIHVQSCKQTGPCPRGCFRD